MKAENGYWSPEKGFVTKAPLSEIEKNEAQLVFYFGSYDLLKNKPIYESLKERYPKASILGCSTGGEIINDEVNDDSCVYAAIHFNKSNVKVASSEVNNAEESLKVGEKIGKELNQKNLKAIFLLSEGLQINGSELVRGLNSQVDTSSVVVSGGLAGDGSRFENTLVGCNGKPKSNYVGAVGVYGDHLSVKTGSEGGWETFGPERKITRSEGNILYELDGKPALDLYKKYLGEEADKLPASALHFPLAIWPEGDTYENSVIRTILSVDEKNQSMTFAGDVPEGYHLRLMWGKFDNIVDGAINSAREATPNDNRNEAQSVSILISCLGRKALMGQRIIDEVEQTSKILGNDNVRVGFYSYGEIAKHQTSGISVLHNQTMTITTLSEG